MLSATALADSEDRFGVKITEDELPLIFVEGLILSTSPILYCQQRGFAHISLNEDYELSTIEIIQRMHI